MPGPILLTRPAATEFEIISRAKIDQFSRNFIEQSERPRCQWLGSSAASRLETYERNVAAFRQGLTETGYIDGQNIALRSASAIL